MGLGQPWEAARGRTDADGPSRRGEGLGRGGGPSGAGGVEPIARALATDGDFADERVLITGASSGIGAGLAVDFARRGAIVGICARRTDRLGEVLRQCRKHSPACRMWPADLSDPGAVDRLAEVAIGELGGVDILVNNAGMPKRVHVTRLDPASVESVTTLNYLSPVRLTLALLPQMLARRRGHIINIASVAATLSSPGESAYDGSKAALTAFSEAMAIDLWSTGVKVLIVHPALVDTELLQQAGNEPVPPAPLDPVPVGEVVDAIFTAVAAGAAQVYVPAWFEQIAVVKSGDLAGFLAGAAAYTADASSPPAVLSSDEVMATPTHAVGQPVGGRPSA